MLGSPALHSTEGLADWVEEAVGDLAESWPDHATVIVCIRSRRPTPSRLRNRGSPPGATARMRWLRRRPCRSFSSQSTSEIAGMPMEGIASGTSVDLLLGSEEPLDLVIVVAPLAAAERRPGARFYEDIFDRFGRTALEGEIELVKETWPDTEFLVIRPDHRVPGSRSSESDVHRRRDAGVSQDTSIDETRTRGTCDLEDARAPRRGEDR